MRRRRRIAFWKKVLSWILLALLIILIPSTYKTLIEWRKLRNVSKEKEEYIQSTKERQIKQVDEIIKVGLERIDLRGAGEVEDEDAIYSPEYDTPKIFKE